MPGSDTAHRAAGRMFNVTPDEGVFSAADTLCWLTREVGPEELRHRQEGAWRSCLQSTGPRLCLLRDHGRRSLIFAMK